eukprot:6247266-Amphidinium_carterae.1
MFTHIAIEQTHRECEAKKCKLLASAQDLVTSAKETNWSCWPFNTLTMRACPEVTHRKLSVSMTWIGRDLDLSCSILDKDGDSLASASVGN